MRARHEALLPLRAHFARLVAARPAGEIVVKASDEPAVERPGFFRSGAAADLAAPVFAVIVAGVCLVAALDR